MALRAGDRRGRGAHAPSNHQRPGTGAVNVVAPSASRVIPANDYRRVRWRNGTGWTREIVAARAGDAAALQVDDWDWRLSIAEIEADGPFSTFPGIERELVLLRGEGVRLRFGDGRVADALPPHGRVRFAGEDAVQGELVDGITHDFNLMWRRGRVDATLWHRPLVGPMLVFVDPGSTWAVHLLAGQARFGRDSTLPALAMGDTALLGAEGGARTRHLVEGTGEALVIRIDARG